MTIVETAREYLGTPYHHQARLKGFGVDCVGLLICVARDRGIVDSEFDIRGYNRVPDGVSLMHHLDDRMDRIGHDEMQPGDCVCVTFDADPQHVGIVGDYRHGGLSIIHAANRIGRVVEHRLLFTPAMRFCAAYRFREVA